MWGTCAEAGRRRPPRRRLAGGGKRWAVAGVRGGRARCGGRAGGSGRLRRGAVLYLGAPTVSRVNAWLAAAGHRDGPLFRRVRRGGRVEGDPGRRLSVNAIRRIIRRRAAAVGIEGRVSGHSLRVGGAQSLAAGGASIVEMQTAGRWQSPAMPGHYARGQLAARGAVARVRYGRG